MSNWRHQGHSFAKKYPNINLFVISFGGTWGILPPSVANHTQTIHWWTTNIVLFVHAQPCDCLFNSLHEPTSKGTSNLCFIGLLWGKSTGDHWIPLSKGQWCGKGFHIMKDIMKPGSWSLTEKNNSLGMLARWLGISYTCKVMGGRPQGTILKIARKKARQILKNIKSDLQLKQVYCSRWTIYSISLTKKINNMLAFLVKNWCGKNYLSVAHWSPSYYNNNAILEGNTVYFRPDNHWWRDENKPCCPTNNRVITIIITFIKSNEITYSVYIFDDRLFNINTNL